VGVSMTLPKKAAASCGKNVPPDGDVGRRFSEEKNTMGRTLVRVVR